MLQMHRNDAFEENTPIFQPLKTNQNFIKQIDEKLSIVASYSSVILVVHDRRWQIMRNSLETPVTLENQKDKQYMEYILSGDVEKVFTNDQRTREIDAMKKAYKTYLLHSENETDLKDLVDKLVVV